MSNDGRRRADASHAVVAFLDDRPGPHKVELSSLVEVPLPGRPPVTLAGGVDAQGVIPGFAEALVRRDRVVTTLVHCPMAPQSYALEEVLIRSGEIELHLLLFPSERPSSDNDAMAVLTLRFQTRSGHVEGRVQARTARKHAASRAERLAQARSRATTPASRVSSGPSTRSPEPAAEDPYVLDIDDDDDLPPPFDPGRMFDGSKSVGRGRPSTLRLVGLFALFLATVGTWQIFESNQEGVAHDTFNRRLAEREAEARAAAAEPDAPSTTVRLHGAPEVGGELAEAALEDALLPVLGEVGRCYRDLEGWATLPPEGAVRFQIVLNPHGAVTGVEVLEQALESDQVVECAVGALEGLAGLTPDQGSATVALTLDFSG